jgi:hypothetical protein
MPLLMMTTAIHCNSLDVPEKLYNEQIIFCFAAQSSMLFNVKVLVQGIIFYVNTTYTAVYK